MIDANGNVIPDGDSFDVPPMPMAPQGPQGPSFLDKLGTGLGNAWNKMTTQDPRYPAGVSPMTSGLAGLAGAYGQAAMPSRMPVPFGAVLGAGAQGLNQGIGDATKQMSMYQQAQGQGLQNQGQDIQNQLARSQLPLTLAKNQAMQSAYQNPQFQQRLMQAMGMAGTPSQGPAPQTQGNPTAAALASLPDDKTRTMAMNALMSQNVPQAAWAPWIATLHGESGWNLNAPDNHNQNGTVDVGPGQVNSSNWQKYGLNDKTARDPQQNLNASAGIFNASWQAGGGDPNKAMAGYNTGSPNGALPSYGPKANAQLAQWAGGGGQGDSGINPQNAAALAENARQNAILSKQFGIGDPVPWEKQAEQYGAVATAGPQEQAKVAAGQAVHAQTDAPIAGAVKSAQNTADVPMKAYENQLAQQLQTHGAKTDLAFAGPIQAEKSANSNLDLRADTMARAINPETMKPEWYKNPRLEKVTDPATGQETYMHVAPAMPNAPPGSPGTAEPVTVGGKPALAALSPQTTIARDEVTKEHFGQDQKDYEKAKGGQGWLSQIEQAGNAMNQAGQLYMTGPNASLRYGLMSHANDLLRTAGMPQAQFNPEAIGSWEEMKKATTNAGFELAASFEGHSRQAASTIVNATSAIPGEHNSPEGFHRVVNGVREAQQFTIDQHEYAQNAFNTGGAQSLTNALTNYEKQFPPAMYTDRAISGVKPISITDPTQLNKYLPGTYIQLPNGRLSQVPARPGAPAVPSYLQQQQPAQ
jgi:Transglycosylase SLT domain